MFIYENQTDQLLCKDCIDKKEVEDVITSCLDSKNYLIDQDTGRFICHKKIGCVTIWVEFKVDTDTYIYNVYYHRMDIKEEL